MWLSRTNWILNHSLSRLRGYCHVGMTWGAIAGVTPVTSSPRVRWIATSVPIGWVAIPRPLVRVTAVRWITMCSVCWNESKEAWVDFYCVDERMQIKNAPFNSLFSCRKRELTLRWASGSINRHHTGVFSFHLQNNKTQSMLRSRKTHSLVWVWLDAMWVRIKHPEIISGDQVVKSITFTLGGWYQWWLYCVIAPPS